MLGWIGRLLGPDPSSVYPCSRLNYVGDYPLLDSLFSRDCCMLKIQSNVSHSCMQIAWRGCRVDMLMIDWNRNTRGLYMLTCHYRCWIHHALLAYGYRNDSRLYRLYAWYVHIWNWLNNMMIHQHWPLEKLRISWRHAESITHRRWLYTKHMLGDMFITS